MVCVRSHPQNYTMDLRRNNSHMTNSTRLKGIIPLAGIILSSYALTTGAPAGNGVAYPVADGAAVFASKCATCHGKDGRGIPNWRSKGQPDFKDAKWQKSRTDAQIADATKNGKGKYMPAFKAKLSDDDITAVVARIRAFAKK
jgi:cytochrome c6